MAVSPAEIVKLTVHGPETVVCVAPCKVRSVPPVEPAFFTNAASVEFRFRVPCVELPAVTVTDGQLTVARAGGAKPITEAATAVTRTNNPNTGVM